MQLKMIRYSGEVTKRDLPQGYSFVFFKESEKDVDAWCDICRRADMVKTNENEVVFNKTIRSCKGLVPEKDLFFVVDPNGNKVATSALIHRTENNSGYLHMVAAVPEVRNKGIGHAMLSFAMSLAEQRGIDFCVLTTDDYRLPAIKNYLSGGFCPVIFHDPNSDMMARWTAVCEKLGYDINSIKLINE